MAVYRQVHVSFWQDPDVLEYTPEEKYFYLYLMTNSKTTQCGIYELPQKVMELETGYNRETVGKLINRFIEYQKILFDPKTKEIMLLNWAKYNWSKSEKILSCVKKELSEVKSVKLLDEYDRAIKKYGYSIDTLSIEWGEEKEKEKEEEENNIPYAEIVNYLNAKTGKNFSPKTEATIKYINGRFSEGRTLEDFKRVIDVKCAEWLGKKDRDGKPLDNYLRPKTLFTPTNFENYLNQCKPYKPRPKVTELNFVETDYLNQ